MRSFILAAALLIVICTESFAAVGCSLNDPDRDVKVLFPESTGYKTTFVTLKEIGGFVLQKEVEDKLGDKFDTVYESLDVPYAYYVVLKGKDTIGYIHGVNQKGKYGAMQLVIATDPKGKIRSFYYQRLSSSEAGKFTGKSFTEQFKGLSLDDFMAYNVLDKNKGAGRVARITDPSKSSPEDFRATLRGIKKNLILLDTFLGKQLSQGVDK
jgi:hypothetical protein